MAAVTETEPELWDELCEIIGYHDKPGDDCIETLNRLLHKHPSAKPPLLASCASSRGEAPRSSGSRARPTGSRGELGSGPPVEAHPAFAGHA